MEKLISRAFLASLALAAGLGGCSEQEFNIVTGNTRVGELSLSGRVCDTETLQWLGNAIVYTHLIDGDGFLFDTVETTTDADGYWTMDQLADGLHYTIYVQHGSKVIDMFEIDMPSDDVVLDEPDCTGSADVEVAVITGDYDQLDEVLGKVGVTSYDLINGLTGDTLVQFLSNPANLVTYDAIFFPGGHIEEDVIYDTDGVGGANVAAVRDAIRTYVEGGGLLYASDWSYDVVESIWPDRIDFLGDDAIPDEAQKGEPALVTSRVSDGDLESAIGASTVDLDFDLDAWPVIAGVAGGTRVYMRADVPWREGMTPHTIDDSPILVSFPEGSGRVVFSSWRQYTNAEGDALEVIKYLLQGL